MELKMKDFIQQQLGNGHQRLYDTYHAKPALEQG